MWKELLGELTSHERVTFKIFGVTLCIIQKRGKPREEIQAQHLRKGSAKGKPQLLKTAHAQHTVFSKSN